MVKIKGTNTVTVSLAFLLIIAVLFAAVLKSSEGTRFTSLPAHSVITKWYGSNGRRQKLAETKVTKEITLHAESEFDCSGKSVIIKVNNLKVSAYTKGRFLYADTSDGKALTGTRTLIFSANEIKKGGEIHLRLSPVIKEAGSITAPIYVTDNNDYLFTLLCREKGVIISTAIMLSCALISLLCAVFAVLQKRRKFAYLLYLSALFLMSALCSLGKSELMQFAVASSELRYIIRYVSYMLLPLPLLAFSTGITKRYRTVSAVQLSLMAYAVIRLLLFQIFSVSLSGGAVLSHLALFASVAVSVTVLSIKLRERFRSLKGKLFGNLLAHRLAPR